MRIVLEPRCSDGFSIDSDPHWNVDSFVSEIASVEKKKLNVFTRPIFSMSLEEEDRAGKRFFGDEIYSSDESDDDDVFDLYEEVMIKDHRTEVKEAISNQVSVVEKEILREIETVRSAIDRIEKAQKEAAESGLTLEKERLKKLEELEATNQWLKNKDFSSFEKDIAMLIRQISGTEDNVTAKTNEIVKIFNDPRCPLSISIAAFAKKMVSASQNPFACSYVIVYVTSQFPQAMDILLAELHKACVYTVPKHDVNSEPAWDESDAYYKRIDSIVRLYAALVQTDIRGTNIHGIEHGWAWFNRFLNNISTNNRATATALNAFLQTAGFGLHQSYKSQFLRAVNLVRERFLAELKAKKDSSDLRMIITEITAYLDDRMYLKEPQGRTMQRNLLSTKFTAQVAQQNNNHHYYYRDYY